MRQLKILCWPRVTLTLILVTWASRASRASSDRTSSDSDSDNGKMAMTELVSSNEVSSGGGDELMASRGEHQQRSERTRERRGGEWIIM